MTLPSAGPCAPWAVADDVCAPCAGLTFDTGVLENALLRASEILFALSGRQFAGACEATERPCGSCGCEPNRCGCGSLSKVRLGGSPIRAVSEVIVDGVILDTSTYRVDDYRYLVRLRDLDGSRHSWPCCQDLSLDPTEPKTWQVTYTYGADVPLSGVAAAAELGCQLALACDPQAGAVCQLPQRVTSIVRQDVSMAILDPFTFLDDGKTGLYNVDLFLKAFNPAGLRRRATAVSPDSRSAVSRIGT